VEVSDNGKLGESRGRKATKLQRAGARHAGRVTERLFRNHYMYRLTTTRLRAWGCVTSLIAAGACADPVRPAFDSPDAQFSAAAAAGTAHGIAAVDTAIFTEGELRLVWTEPVTTSTASRNKVVINPTWTVRDTAVVAKNSVSGMSVMLMGMTVGTTYVVGRVGIRYDSVKVTVNQAPPPPVVEAPVSNLPNQHVARPRVTLDGMVASARGAATLRTIRPATSADLQAAIDTGKMGDVIELTRGAVYVGTVTLKNKTSGTGWITIRGAQSTLPAPGTRIRPSQQTALPKLIAEHPASPVITTEPGAHNYLLQGIEVTAAATAQQGYALVTLGTGREQTTLASQPSQIVLDRVYVHGTATFDFQRCVLLNGGSLAVVDSWISDCHGKGYDSQAILAYNGSGPFKIQNNYLEGAGENIMFGGADASSAALMPADIEIIGNHVFKPLAWAGKWTIKNLIEFKVGLRARVTGNVFENCWADAQGGTAILLKTVNQEGSAPFSETRDIAIQGNTVRNAVAGVGMAARPEASGGVPMSHIEISDNWFDRMGSGAVMSTEGVSYLYVERNTGVAGRSGLRFNGGPAVDSVIVRSNVFVTTQAGAQETISGDGVMYGVTTLNTFARSWVVELNIFVGSPANYYPTGNFYPGSNAAVGFMSDVANPMIASSSEFYGLGDGHRSPGAPMGYLTSNALTVVVAK
jgi:hypothetical protein